MSRIEVAAGPRSANRSLAASKIAATTSSRAVGILRRAILADPVVMRIHYGVVNWLHWFYLKKDDRDDTPGNRYPAEQPNRCASRRCTPRRRPRPGHRRGDPPGAVGPQGDLLPRPAPPRGPATARVRRVAGHADRPP